MLAVLAATQPDETSAWALGLSGIALFGFLTFRRIVYRNVKSDEYKVALAMVRRHFLERDPTLEPAVFLARQAPLRRRRTWGRGGLSETLTAANCAAAAAVPAIALWSTSPTLAVLASAATAVVAGLAHWAYAELAYSKASEGRAQSTSARR